MSVSPGWERGAGVEEIDPLGFLVGDMVVYSLGSGRQYCRFQEKPDPILTS